MGLRLWVDISEGQVDAWASVMVLFSHLMLIERDKEKKYFIFRCQTYLGVILVSRKSSMSLGGSGSEFCSGTQRSLGPHGLAAISGHNGCF